MSKPKAKKEEKAISAAQQPVNRREVGIFLALTFALTYLLDLFFWYMTSHNSSAQNLSAFHLQVRMLIPAACVIGLGVFCFQDSPIHRSTFHEQVRYFFYFYLVYTLVFLGLGVSTIFVAGDSFFTISVGVVEVATIAGILMAIRLRTSGGEEPYRRAGLSFGKFRYFILFGLLFAALQVAMVSANYLLGLGKAIEAPGATVTWYIVNGLRKVTLYSILGTMLAFGEEYGWRGYLQGELIKLGLLKGLALVGLIWGLWQAPLAIIGYKYPGHPLEGVAVTIVYCLVFSFILGLIKLKTGSVWLVALLVSISDQTWLYLSTMIYEPKNPILSFGPGIYGLALLAVLFLPTLAFYLNRGQIGGLVDKKS